MAVRLLEPAYKMICDICWHVEFGTVTVWVCVKDDFFLYNSLAILLIVDPVLSVISLFSCLFSILKENLWCRNTKTSMMISL